jgi:hypothetical protein
MKLSRTHLALVFVLSVGMCGWLIPGAAFGYDVENIEIQLSPNVLNMGSKGDIVTVHTDLPYAAVVGASVYLNDVPISWWKSDDRGYFVAKFAMDRVKTEADLVVGDNTVSFTGVTTGGVEFYGDQILKVVSIIPKK